MYPETASFPAGTWVANTRERTRSTYWACERGSRWLYDREKRIGNRGSCRDDALFLLPK